MRIFNVNVAGVIVSALLFGFSSSVSAQGLWQSDPDYLQFEREVRSTYIVRLSGELPAQAVNARANEVAARFGGRIKHVYSNTINGFAITMPSVAMTNMVRARGLGIVSVTRDQIVTIDKGKPSKPGNGGGGTTLAACDQRVPWGVARVTGIANTTTTPTEDVTTCTVSDDSYFGTDSAKPDYGDATSTGLQAPRVCVLDTGVDQDNPELNVNVGLSLNFSNDKSSDDLHGHGTHVAGIIAARSSDGRGVVGVAPNAEIVSIKVLNRRGSGSYSRVIAGVDSIATGLNPVCAVANMSLGGPDYSLLVAAVRCAAATDSDASDAGGCNVNATPSGIIFTLAAGNAKDDAKNHSPANASRSNDNIYTIAAMSEGDVWASTFSNYGQPPVDYIQPGVAIESTVKGGGYATWSGTSMAAPHMAGLVVRSIVNGVAFTTDGAVERISGDDYAIAVDGDLPPPPSSD